MNAVAVGRSRFPTRRLYLAPMTREERLKYDADTIEQVTGIDAEYGGPIDLSGDDTNRPKQPAYPAR